MNRLPKDFSYSFISVPLFKVCHTTDAYFPTDDDRWASGNYFKNQTEAQACFAEIAEKWADKIDTLKAKKEAARVHYISTTSDIAETVKAARNSRTKKEIVPENLLSDLVTAFDTFNNTRLVINAELTDINKQIDEFITNYPKTL